MGRIQAGATRASAKRLFPTHWWIDNNAFANYVAIDQLEFELIVSRQRLAGL